MSWLTDDQMLKVGYPNLDSRQYSEEDSRDGQVALKLFIKTSYLLSTYFRIMLLLIYEKVLDVHTTLMV